MKKIYFKLLILLFVVNLSQAQEKKVNIPSSDTLKMMLHQMEVPALGIGIIEKGEIKYIKVLGELSEGKAAPRNTLFNVASLTKSLSTMVTLELVSQGKWELDTPLYHYWIDPDVKEDPNHQKLTTRHVLSHQSGFVNWRWMHETKKLNFDFVPGTKTQYSGEGFEYLRRALEKKFNKDLEALAKELIFDPLGMSDSWLTGDPKMDASRMAQAHKNLLETYPAQIAETPNAADDLWTTISDFGTFAIDVINKTKTKESVYKEMTQAQSVVRPGINFGLGWIYLMTFLVMNMPYLMQAAIKG